MTDLPALLRGLASAEVRFIVVGGIGYEDLLPHTVELHVFGVPCRVVTLSKLVTLKRAAGRPKDLEAIAELEALSEEQGD